MQNEPYWKPFFDGFPPIHQWLDKVQPDVVVVFYNDHGLNFFLDKMPTFAVGAATTYSNADEGWGIPTLPLKLICPDHEVAPVQILPIDINTVQFPLPTAKRVYRLVKAVGEAIKSGDSDQRVAVMATGGLSHQLEGERAGFINKKFDLQFLDSMETNP